MSIIETKRDECQKRTGFCTLTQQFGQRSTSCPSASSPALRGMTRCHSLWCHQRCCFAYRWCRPWSETWCLMGNRVPPVPSHLWMGERRNKKDITQGFPQDRLGLAENILTLIITTKNQNNLFFLRDKMYPYKYCTLLLLTCQNWWEKGQLLLAQVHSSAECSSCSSSGWAGTVETAPPGC